MSDRKPLVQVNGLVQQIQSGDILVDASGDGYVTAASAFSLDEEIVIADGTARAVKASGVTIADITPSADTVTAASAFSAAGRILLAGGADRTATDSSAAIQAAGSFFRLVLSQTHTDPIYIGDNAADSIVSIGDDCVAVGPDAIASATLGNGVIAIGSDALQSSTVGTQVTAVGRDVGEGSTIGADTVLLGQCALSATIGSNCFIGGSLAGFQANLGNFTVAFGQNAFRAATTGTSCFAFGRDAGRLLNSASANDNLFFGNQSGNVVGQKTDATGSIAFGANSYTTSNNQVVLGSSSVTNTSLRGTVEVIRSTNACNVRVYNTASGDPDAGSNYERLLVGWSSNVATLHTQAGGTGTVRALAIGTNGTTRITVGASGGFTVADAQNFAFNTTTGSKLGTATNQKLGFWNATPIVQPAAANQAALTNSTGGSYDGTLAAVSGSGDDATINNNFTDVHTLLNEIRTALVNAGLIKGAA